MKKRKAEEQAVFIRPIDKGVKKLLAVALTLAVALVCFFPIYWMIATSLKTQLDFLEIPPKLIFKPTLNNFRYVLARADFALAYRNSFIISFSAVGLALLFGLPASYGISRFRFRFRSVLSFWVLSTRFIPPVVVIIPFYLIFRTLGLINTLKGMVLIHLVAALPLVIWIMYSFFKEVPEELEECAVLDGASPFMVFLKIVLPLVSPGGVATAVIALMGSWNEMLYSMILTTPDTRPLTVAIYNFVSFEQIAWGNLCAAAVLAIAPILLFTFLIQRYLVSGLTFGAVKG